ncbi:MAG: hypothetical protein WCR53_02375 [Bacteroidaceae bacterium]|jgi:hypothetical protein
MKNSKQNKPVCILFKSRSYRANFNEALEFLTANIKTFIVSLFPPAVATGLLLATLFVIFRHTAGHSFIIVTGIGVLLITYFTAVLRQGLKEMMKDYQRTNTVRQLHWKKDTKTVLLGALTSFYLLFLQVIILCALIALTALLHVKLVYVLSPVIVVILFLIVPFNLSLNQLQYGEGNFFQSIINGFKSTVHYYGSTLILLFISLCVFLLVFAICYLPIFILNLSIAASNEAVSLGDPTDLPMSVFVLHFILSLILLSIIHFSSLLWALPQYFHYFSLLKKDEERKKEQEKLNAVKYY